MNIAVAFSFLSPALFSCVANVTLASQILIISPFDKADVDVVAGKSNAQSSVQHLRATLVAGELNDQLAAGAALVRLGDDKSIARLVYALKQGNSLAGEILGESASIHVVPYLLEDVAHGSMELIEGYPLSGFGRVRTKATMIMAETLANIPDLPAESSEWLKEIKTLGSGGLEMMFVPEVSKALLEWWEHNGEAVLTARYHDATWLPPEKTIRPLTFEAWSKMNRAKPPLPPPPIPRKIPSARTVHVEESFEDWSLRVVDPNRRDVTWASVDFETGRSVKPDVRHKNGSDGSKKTLDWGANQSDLASRPPSRSNKGTTDTVAGLPSPTPWSMIVVSIMAASGLLWLLLKRRS